MFTIPKASSSSPLLAYFPAFCHVAEIVGQKSCIRILLFRYIVYACPRPVTILADKKFVANQSLTPVHLNKRLQSEILPNY